MASSHRLALVTSLLASTLLLGCPGTAGKDGTNGSDGAAGLTSLVQMAPEPQGANCVNGGTRIQVGVDANRSGVLDPLEVSSTQFVCNGAPGAAGHASLLASSPEVAGANCAAGGTRIQSGVDLDDDGTLDAGEVSSTQYVCSGANGTNGSNGQTALVATSTELPGPNCADGGIRVQSGLDADGDATLDAGEVALTRFVCNGANGASGTNGLTSLVATSVEGAGANCTHGGARIDSGVDANASGALDPAEISATQFACNGAPGADALNALVATSAEQPGAACAEGGTKIESGLDADRDGTLDAAEVSATAYACNGANGTNGADGLTSLVAVAAELAGANCAAGGTRIQSGLDADRSGTLEPAELAITTYVCNGAAGTNGTSGTNGADGTDGVTSLVALSPVPGPADCVNGGARIQSGLDANANGLLDPLEVATTQFVCDGADGTNGTDGANGQTSLLVTAAEGAGPNCTNGGTRIVAGLDANGNGLLDPAEEGAPRYACNGTPGAAGFTSLVATSPYSGASCAFGGIQVDSGLDDDGSGALSPAEVDLTQYVCHGADGANGAPGATSLVTTTPAAAGGTCQFGGTQIDSGLDANGNGLLDTGEATSTAYACNGAAGAGLTTLIAFTPEPAGPNCAFGGTRVDSGIDGNGDGLLDPAEVSATQYLCNADTTHPTVVGVTPAPGILVLPSAAPLCVTFSEAIDPLSLDASSLKLEAFGTSIATDLTYDPGTVTACLAPVLPLLPWTSYSLVAADLGTQIRDLAGNPLIPSFSAQYSTVLPPQANLRVRIDALAPGAGTVDVSYTVENVGPGDAGPFAVGFFADPPGPPGVGDLPAASVDLTGGLASGASASGTIQVGAPASAIIAAYADVAGAVAESDEGDNLGILQPALTGPIGVNPNPAEELTQITVSLPVNASTRFVQLFLGSDLSFGSMWLGSMSGNFAGEGVISATFLVPGPVPSGPVSIWAYLQDGWSVGMASYVAYDVVSTTNLAVRLGGGPADPWVDSGIPLTFLTITPPTRPNLRVTIDSLTDVAPGSVEVAYTVSNVGFGDVPSYTLGFFVDPPDRPSTGALPDASVDLGPLPAGDSISGVFTVTAGPSSSIIAFADPSGAVDELDEMDNLAILAPEMTGSPIALPATVEAGGQVTLTVPVSRSARSVEIFLGSDFAMGPSYWVGSGWGNDAGQGSIDVSFTVPPWLDPATSWSVWVTVRDPYGLHFVQYLANGTISATEYTRGDFGPGGGTWEATTLSLTFLDVTPPTRPNLVVSIDAVTDLGGGNMEVAYTVSNVGFGDAGPFSVGFFVDPMPPPGVGSVPLDAVDVAAGLAQGSSFSGLITLPGGPSSGPVAYVDLGGAVDELSEMDNTGRVPAMLTGPVALAPSTVEQSATFTITVPVNRTARRLEARVRDPMGGDWWLGNAWGNDAGEGFLSGTFALPAGLPPGDWIVELYVWDD